MCSPLVQGSTSEVASNVCVATLHSMMRVKRLLLPFRVPPAYSHHDWVPKVAQGLVGLVSTSRPVLGSLCTSRGAWVHHHAALHKWTESLQVKGGRVASTSGKAERRW